MHNQNETQQHGGSKHVDRPFLYTYVPNLDAESFFFYSAGKCFYCTRAWCGMCSCKSGPGYETNAFLNSVDARYCIQSKESKSMRLFKANS